MYPRLVIDLKKYEDNIKLMLKICQKHKIQCVPVTKVFGADEKLLDVMYRLSIDIVGDSRIQNFKMMEPSIKKMLLRLPMLSDVRDVITWTDISLNSEITVLRALNEEAKRQQKMHGFILMIDLGDLREGIYYRDLDETLIEELNQLDHLTWMGIGTNLTCYGGVIPDDAVYQKLFQVLRFCEKVSKKKMTIVSGGNSSSIELLMEGKLPSFVNQLRIGEAIILGRETAFGKKIPDFYDDVITLEVELIELKIKPSKPEGNIGMDAFGEVHVFDDRGMILRALGAIGRQDVFIEHLIPPEGIHLLGASSDHLVMEITSGHYQIGDIVTFKLTYGGILSLMTSRYVEKHYVR